MIRSLALLSARPDMPHDEFVDYYENHHVPLIMRLVPPPGRYWRTYLPPADERTADADFDVVTQMEFADEAARVEWLDDVRAEAMVIAADEARFLDRGKTRSWVVTIAGSDQAATAVVYGSGFHGNTAPSRTSSP